MFVQLHLKLGAGDGDAYMCSSVKYPAMGADGRIQDFRMGGAQVERRRREYRGAAGAEGGGVWGGGIPLLIFRGDTPFDFQTRNAAF